MGETLRDAVRREALEETGLEVEPGDLVELLERVFPDRQGRIRYHYVLADYLCRVSGGELNAGSDVLDARWASSAELKEFKIAQVTMKVMEKALAHL